MKTPFTTEQFFLVFEHYNLKIFPAQLIIVILGIAALLLVHSKNRYKNKLIGCYLGLLWIWTGLVYHIVFFSGINKAAYVFGGIFIIQGIMNLVNTFNQRLIFMILVSAIFCRYYIAQEKRINDRNICLTSKFEE